VFKTLIKKLAIELEKNGLPYMLIGGQAVLLYGEPRLTKDIDITLGVDSSKFDIVSKVVETCNLKALVDNPKDFVNDVMVFPVIEESSGIRVDFIFSFSPYEREAIDRAKKINFEEVLVNFASLEDVIIHKTIAGRPRDIDDIKSIILKNPNFDRKYIKQWLKQFDLSLGEKFEERFEYLL